MKHGRSSMKFSNPIHQTLEVVDWTGRGPGGRYEGSTEASAYKISPEVEVGNIGNL